MGYDRNIAGLILTGSAILLAGHAAKGAEPASRPAADLAALRKRAEPAINKGCDFLLTTQTEEGGWKGYFGGADPAITALAAEAIARNPAFGPRHQTVARAVEFVLKHQQPDGGVYDPQIGYENYTTSVALSLLSSIDNPALDHARKEARRYLIENQWAESREDNEGDKIDSGHPWYGGAGYGKHKRPDLSNTQMMVEALHNSGLPADDPVFQKALRFIARCQMSSQTNDQPFARGADSGGFIYTPANNGESMAGSEDVNGRTMLRSYGSMTYAGFKSMLYARVKRDDPRVQNAWKWIQRHYTLDANPNMPGIHSKQGLYYYYHVFAKALSAWGEPIIEDAQGQRHDWRAELVDELLKRQNVDGSWVNDADRWMEGNPQLVTAYSLLALEEALKDEPSR